MKIPFLDVDKIFKRDTCEIRVSMLGPRRAGKTSMLTAMYERFENAFLAEKISDCIALSADSDTKNVLQQNYMELERIIRTGGCISEAITGDADEKTYQFALKRNRNDLEAKIRVRFQDYPGGWLMAGSRDVQDQNYRQVLDFVKSSHILLVAIDTPYLMEDDGKYNERRNIVSLITQTVRAAWTPSDGLPRMVLLVPIKCEKYDRGPEARSVLVESVRKAYSDFLDYLRQLPQCAVICVPAQTTGCVLFDHFEYCDDLNDLPSPVFSMPTEISRRTYCPRDCSQALRFCLLYAIRLFVKDGEKGLGGFARRFLKSDQQFLNAADRIVAGCKGTFFQNLTKES